MAIDVLKSIEALEGQFRGAVLFTYTLDLLFFEELVLPKLEALGCTNVVIIADRHGYDQATIRGGNYLKGVGRRYVCTPLVTRGGTGVQHAKLIMLVGPQRGHLLVGSGNLTMPGLGGNLEQFVTFEHDTESTDEAVTAYPFRVINQLVATLRKQSSVSSIAAERLQVIDELAPWMNEPIKVVPDDLRLWHSIDDRLLSQWVAAEPLEELRLMAPFWNINMVEQLVKRFRPKQLVIGVDSDKPRIDGRDLAKRAQQWGCVLQLNAIHGPLDRPRALHAKTYVGIGKQHTWCMTGSANCTFPALSGEWNGNGNLELVVWQHSAERSVFDAVWNDETLRVVALNPEDVIDSEREETSSENEEDLRLVEIRYESQILRGRFHWRDLLALGLNRANQWHIELLSRVAQLPMEPTPSGEFEIHLSEPIDKSEAGRVVLKYGASQTIHSQYHWIDQPAVLVRHGNRSYHVSVNTSLQTFAGAGTLFEELLNFLWHRVDPSAIEQERHSRENQSSQQRSSRAKQQETDSELTAPPAHTFITDEHLIDTLSWHVESYVPHQHSTLTLRELLSLTLLRLTVETTSGEDGTIDVDEDGEENTEPDQKSKERRSVLDHLRRYLLQYCKRYATRLTDPQFVRNTNPDLIFQNHFTLGRIILEFADKAPQFSNSDLRWSVMHILSPLFWPVGVGLSGQRAWKTLEQTGYSEHQLREKWEESGMHELSLLMIGQAWEFPVAWTTSKPKDQHVQTFLVGRELLNRMSFVLGKKFWMSTTPTPIVKSIFGFRRLADLNEPTSQPLDLQTVQENITALKKYLTPAAAKYIDLIALQSVRRSRNKYPYSVAVTLEDTVRKQGLTQELKLIHRMGDKGQIRAIIGEETKCPNCHVALPTSKHQILRRYELQLCPTCQTTVIYWEPSLDVTVITLDSQHYES